MRKSIPRTLINLVTIAFLFLPQTIIGQINFGLNSDFKYLKGKDAASLPASWTTTGFDDSGWASGKSPFQYGKGVGGTYLADMINKYSTLFLRSTFKAYNTDRIDTIHLSIDFDDGFILWINGIKVLTVNAPANPTYNSFAPVSRDPGIPLNYFIPSANVSLKEGDNSISVQCFNSSIASIDFFFGMKITEAPLFDRVSAKPVFSAKAGFYSNPFTLTISSPSPEYEIAYTLDGSNPEDSPTAILGGASTNVLIDPQSSVGRPVTPAVILRASLFGSNVRYSFPIGASYIFTSEVPTQKYPGGGWPVETGSGQIIDLTMDSNVVNDPMYSSQMDFSLKSIPTISIITDLKNLFDPLTGLYMNADGHGETWERECSAELINPDGSKGFQIDCGLRIRGGWSRHDNYPKHAFRLFFNSQYGTAKLDFPLFGNEGTSKFDKIDLRCEQNYSWANAGAGGDPIHNTAVREVFSRDTQRDLGEPYSRSSYYHLYLNGMYWGLYQTQERTEANFASTYLGGVDSDYDVVKVNTENWSYRIEATDGTLDSWENIWNLTNYGFSNNADYFNLEGKDSNGNKVDGAPVLINIDNLIDYMLVIFYTGNFDSPTSSYGQNKGANNFFAIYNKTTKKDGFSFYAHDSEHALMTDVTEAGIGLYEDRVNLGSRTDAYKMVVSDFSQFHPQWLHEKLTRNPEYRMRFADRAYKCLRDGGILTEGPSLERFNTRASQINYAIIAESARWGDSKGQYLKTKDNAWIPELDKVRNIFLPARSAILIDQLKLDTLYTSLIPTVIKAGGQEVQTENFEIVNSESLTFQNLNASGDIYYTIDNTDPRIIGGGISPTAIKWSGAAIPLAHTVVVKTRVCKGVEWSALNSANLLRTDEDYSSLKVTELMYHPQDIIEGVDTIPGSSLEYIEFKNTGSSNLNISGLVLDSAVHCIFPANSILGPQQFYVVASKPGSFSKLYGFAPSANYSGNFSNSGEYVLITDPNGKSVISFTYDDKSPWPVEADGENYSLTAVEKNPTGDPNNYLYWRHSINVNGTPFRDEFGVSVPKPESIDARLILYPNPASEILNISINPELYSGNLRIVIYNLNGTQIINQEMNSQKSINLKEFGIIPGVYILKLEGEKILVNRKFVVIN